MYGGACSQKYQYNTEYNANIQTRHFVEIRHFIETFLKCYLSEMMSSGRTAKK